MRVRAIVVVVGALFAAFLIAQRGAATADSCADACQRAYAACTKSCKKNNTNCFTKCINEQQSCLARCP
jgi:hypothetical protein